ncbi:MAG: hypothetical protein EAY75_12410 [Bacteroidetes bacterium]|nr:MAG: hypothetical protein EAY75_12410 [Bacteroidota bacterium]
MGLGALGLSLHGSFLLGNDNSGFLPALISGLVALLYYNLHYGLGTLQAQRHAALLTPRQRFMNAHFTTIFAISLASGILASVLFCALSPFTPSQWWLLGGSGLITAVYSIKANINTRFLHGAWAAWAKPMVLSTAWTVFTLLPWLTTTTNHGHLVTVAIQRFLLLLSICIPFDVRDTLKDRKRIGATLYDSHGIKPLMLFSGVLLLLSLALGFVGPGVASPWLPNCLLMGTAYGLGWVLVRWAFKQPKKLWPFVWLDVHLVVYPLCWWIAQL